MDVSVSFLQKVCETLLELTHIVFIRLLFFSESSYKIFQYVAEETLNKFQLCSKTNLKKRQK